MRRLSLSLVLLTLLPIAPVFAQEVAQEAAKDAGPTYIARDVEPVLENTVEINQLLGRLYPESLRLTGKEATVVLWLFVEKDGTVGATQVLKANEYPTFDEVATEVAESMVFTPATWEGEPVAVWINQAIAFKPGDLKIREQ